MSDPASDALARFALEWNEGDIAVRRVSVAPDERLDGEPILRIMLLLSDPRGPTWELPAVRALRQALGRHAAELGLPPVSVTLVSESEAELFEPSS